MTSKLKTLKISKVSNMSEGIRGLVGKRVSKKYRFMDQDLKINKLSVA
jgi:hypothetical protein